MRSARVAAERAVATAQRRGASSSLAHAQKAAIEEAVQRRQARAKAQRAARAAPVVYAPGHFTAPCYAWWGAKWKPYGTSADFGAAERSRRAMQVAEESRRLGRGFGNGTIDLPNTPGTTAPQWM